nr:hypothetical protein Iba_chr03cCG2670 [Ipomoea batatas]
MFTGKCRLSSSLLSVKGGERERKGVMEMKNGSERKGERDRREEICAAKRRKSESSGYLILRKKINVKVLVE